MRLVFDDRALDDLEQIFDWIAIDSPTNAERVVGRLFSSAELLLSFPLMGRLGQVTGTFEWVVPRLPYVLVYEVDEDEQRVIVIAVLHGARDGEL